MGTLLLDATWRPVKFVKETRAIVLLFKNKVDLVAEWADSNFNSPTQAFAAPAIVRLKKHVAKFTVVSPRFKRKVLYNRDEWTCQYCGDVLNHNSITIDHIIPRCAGGKTSWNNCVASCKSCNRKKGSRSLKDSGLTLLRAPREPAPQHYWHVKDQTKWHPEWSNFLSRNHEK